MTLQEFVQVLRTRWIIVCLTIAAFAAGAITLTLLTTPLYQASTRLFVSTTSGATANELYQGNLFSQQRVLSYTKLLMGETLAQRTIDKLGLDMSATALQKEVTATAAADTVLIDVAVRDPSPVRARDIANALSDEFVGMVAELETSEIGARPDARVVVEQRASASESPVVPEPTRNIVAGLALGLLFGIALAVLRDRFDVTLKSREVLEETAGAGLVANIPFDKERRKDRTISFAADHSPPAEAYRELRTNLQFLEVDRPPRVLVVTSSLPNEGKTTTAINLALALAEAEHNVVLVDGDMRRPKLAECFGLVGSVGLSTVLSGRAALFEVLQQTRFGGLTVLTSGAAPPNPSELLGSLAAKNVMSEMRKHFDYVIIDSSPLLAVTDAAILAAASDGVLMVARFGKTTRDQLAHAVGNLKNVGAPLLGTLFTMTPSRRRTSYNYSYHATVGESSSKLLASPPAEQSPKRPRRHRRARDRVKT